MSVSIALDVWDGLEFLDSEFIKSLHFAIMLFFLGSACSKVMLTDTWSISVPCFYLFLCFAEDLLSISRLRKKTLAHSLESN